MQAGSIWVQSGYHKVGKMEQRPGDESCQHHENKHVFIIDVGFYLNLDHHGSVGDEKNQKEDAEVDK